MDFFLFVCVDHAIGLRIGNASQHVALLHLLLFEERPVGLVHRARLQFPRASGTRARPARVRQLEPRVLGRVQDVGVVGRLNLVLLTIRADQLHLVHSHGRPEAARGSQTEGLGDGLHRPKRGWDLDEGSGGLEMPIGSAYQSAGGG